MANTALSVISAWHSAGVAFHYSALVAACAVVSTPLTVLQLFWPTADQNHHAHDEIRNVQAAGAGAGAAGRLLNVGWLALVPCQALLVPPKGIGLD